MVLSSQLPQSLVASPDPEAGDQNPHPDSFLFCFPSTLSSHTPNSAPDTAHESHPKRINPFTPLRCGCCQDPSASTKTSLLLKGSTQMQPFWKVLPHSPVLSGSPHGKLPVSYIRVFASAVPLAWNSFPFTWPTLTSFLSALPLCLPSVCLLPVERRRSGGKDLCLHRLLLQSLCLGNCPTKSKGSVC